MARPAALRSAGTAPLLAAVAALAACGGMRPSPAAAPLALPDPVQIVDVASGTTLTPAALADRLRAAEFVLLGEQHDNPAHHRVRAALLSSVGGDRASVVFEHWPRGTVALPGTGEPRVAWLDRTGFDRTGWRWPLHEPLVDAVLASGRTWRGSNVSREALRDVVRRGSDGAPPELAAVMRRVPLDSAARAVIDAEIVTGHCGQLPASMVPGMRDAQVVRDVAMATAMLDARASGTPWLVAGNGHVRSDVAVPRWLAAQAPGARVLAVGFMELGADGARPALPPASMYEVVVFTAPATRPDACATFKAPAAPRPPQ
ncbi:MAG: ChaN family lipoprotein [Gemmatimonadetes bacterium]|nr:ChaN family lipoprotein [Gemmatimonadota bacterium]